MDVHYSGCNVRFWPSADMETVVEAKMISAAIDHGRVVVAVDKMS
jgi:hypothetical protein